MKKATTTVDQRTVDLEKGLALVALEDRGNPCGLWMFKRREFLQMEQSQVDQIDYTLYGLIPIHSKDPQLAMAIEEIVNTFSPALYVELLLYNVLGSNKRERHLLGAVPRQLLLVQRGLQTHQDRLAEHDPLDGVGVLHPVCFSALEETQGPWPGAVSKRPVVTT